MTTNASDISSYTFSNDDRLFLDANIWLTVYGPSPKTDRKQRIYSGALKDIRNVGASIFIDPLILSEFINVYARYEYNIFSVNPKPSYKNFRNSTDFIPIAQDIGRQVRYILGMCECVESGFTTTSLHDLLNEFARGGADFNDQMFCRLCTAQEYTFITHDGDFKNSGLTILTCNQKLLI